MCLAALFNMHLFRQGLLTQTWSCTTSPGSRSLGPWPLTDFSRRLLGPWTLARLGCGG